MIQIRKMQVSDLDELYSLLKQTDFPHLPSRYDAEEELQKPDNHIYLGFDSKIICLHYFYAFLKEMDNFILI